ncbi:MAG: guanine deaminase [Candidatus Eisenbacteria bacterium]
MAPSKSPDVTAIRGDLLYCTEDPAVAGPGRALEHVPDGLVVSQGGVITALGPAADLLATLPPGSPVAHYPGCLVAPGFVDAHVHYAQTEMIGTFGAQLLEWLNKTTFPAEQAFAERAHADAVARVFVEELLRNGTTSALVFCATYPASVDALFEAAQAENLRLIAGKTWMDRNAPAPLLDTAQKAYDDSKALIARWHGKGRALYAITPRFAPTSSPEQLEAAGALRREHPDTWLHTHVSENPQEVAWVQELFPERAGYLDVYDHYGLLGRRAVLAHGIYLKEKELTRCHETGTALAHCPTSNLFLGSGLFDVAVARDRRRPVKLGLGTDVGAGTSFSLLRTLDEACKVAQLRGRPLHPVLGFYLATLGGARALALDDRVGTLRVGHEADFVVLDPAATPLLALRAARAQSIVDVLFALITLGDDRAVRATWVAGRLAHERAT